MKICIALDLDSKIENLNLLKEIKKYDIWIKVGLRSFIRDGYTFIEEIKNISPKFKIFLDLKLYDIPNTMLGATEEILKLNIDMFNIHISSGEIAIKKIVEKANEYSQKPLIIGVTALTSFNNKIFTPIYEKKIEEKTKQFAILGYLNGLDGVVCSTFESLEIKKNTNSSFLTISPGIRPFKEDKNDQERVASLIEADKNLVDFAVIGRAIYKDLNPIKKIDMILETISNFK